MFFTKFRFQTQVLLILLFCLAFLGVGMVFLNTYVIAGLKEQMKDEALLLAEEQGFQVANMAREMLEEQQNVALEGEVQNRISDRIALVLQGNDSLIAACVVDGNGQVLWSRLGENPDGIRLQQDAGGVGLEVESGDFESIRLRMQRLHPEMQTVKVPLQRHNQTIGNMMFLVSESGIYRSLQKTSSEITRRLWSVLLAFTGVLALGLYAMARIFRRQVRLMHDNEKLDRMAYLGTLASGLAHEIRNPLNAMSVNLSVADEEVRDYDSDSSPEILSKVLLHLRREVDRLSRSVTSFMQFAHPEANPRDAMEIEPVVEEVLDLLKPQVEETGVAICLRIPEGATIRADFSGFRQVLYNLVLNALQAFPDAPAVSPRIEIGALRESAQWYIWVEDNGPGIPPGQEEQIFEVFHSTKAAGSGFGLAIARGIIQSHDGDIRACRPGGGGTRIEIILPESHH